MADITAPTPAALEMRAVVKRYGAGLTEVRALTDVSVSVAPGELVARDILTIAGAPPGTLARSAGARAWLLAVIGTAMAVPVGFLPVIVFSWASDRNGLSLQGFPIVFPTRTVLLLVIAVPLAVALASWSSSALAQRLRPVRVSTAVFE